MLTPALAQIAGGAVVSGFLSVAGAKILAAGLGPGGFAELGTLQQFRDSAVVAATLNGQTALIQGLSSLTGAARQEFIKTSILLFGVATALVVSGMMVFPDPIASSIGLGQRHAFLIRWLVVPVVLASLYVLLNGLVNALGAVRAAASLQLAAPAGTLLVARSTVLEAQHDEGQGLMILLVVSASLAVIAAIAVLARYRCELGSWLGGPGGWWSQLAVQRFFLLSGAMLLSGLASNWALVSVRAEIVHREGWNVTGQFDAAWSIGLNVSTLLLAGIQAYHLPVLAKARSRNERLAHLKGALQLLAPTAVVLLIGLVALKPFALRLFYSMAFRDAAYYLRWMLPGIYFKVTTWVFTLPMLACGEVNAFLAAEVSGWLSFLVGAKLLAHWRGPAEAASIAFVLMNLVHLAISTSYVRGRMGFRWTSDVWPAWIAGLVMIVVASITYWTPQLGPTAGQLGWGALWTLASSFVQIALARKVRIECVG